MTTWFSTRNGRLRVSCDDPSFEWEELVDGLPVLDLIALPEAAVVLLDPPPGHQSSRNLVGVGADAEVIWRAELPDAVGPDSYVSIEVAEGGLIGASTWSGYRVWISPTTGAFLSRAFTK